MLRCAIVPLVAVISAANSPLQILRLDADHTEVCPDKPVRLTISSSQDNGLPSSMLAFQATWNSSVLRLEDARRSTDFDKPGTCEFSAFKMQPAVRADRCDLPVPCLHGIARQTALKMIDKIRRRQQLRSCSLNPLLPHNYGWLMRDAVAAEMLASEKRCSLPRGVHANDAWNHDSVRGCLKFVIQILKHPKMPYTRNVPRSLLGRALALIAPCTLHHQLESAAFACGSLAGNRVVPAAVNGAMQVWLRAPQNLVASAAQSTSVGILMSNILAGRGYAYAPKRVTRTLKVNELCPAPVCSAGQKSIQNNGAWCGKGARRKCCADCSRGTFAPRAGFNRCIACAPGRFQSRNKQVACDAHRAPCEIGSFESAKPTATSDRICTTCDLKCPAGKHNVDCSHRSAGSCVACPPGRFKATHSTFQCSFHSQSCPVGTFEAQEASNVGDRLCKPCPSGRFQDQRGQTTCKAARVGNCPNGTYLFYAANATADQLCTKCDRTCPAGRVHRFCGGKNPGRCVACAIGRFKASAGTTECVDHSPRCRPGTHEVASGSATADILCQACDEHCPAGRYHKDCGDKNPGSCVPCAAGHFKESAGTHKCVRRTQCPAGKFESTPSKATTRPICVACAKVCPAGAEMRGCGGGSAGSCVACSAGQFKSAAGAHQCKQLSSICPAGKFVRGGGNKTTDWDCAACPAGQHQGNAGRRKCEKQRMQHLALSTVPESDFKTQLSVCPSKPVSLRITSSQSDGRPTNMLAFSIQWDSSLFRLIDMRRSPVLEGKCDLSLMMALPAKHADKCALPKACVASIASSLAHRLTNIATSQYRVCSMDPRKKQKNGRQYGWVLQDAVRDAIEKYKHCTMPGNVTAAADAWQHKSFTACYDVLNKLIDHPRNSFVKDRQLVARIKPCLVHHQTASIGFLCASKKKLPVIPGEVEDVLQVDLMGSYSVPDGQTTIKAMLDARLAGAGYKVLTPAFEATVSARSQCPAIVCPVGSRRIGNGGAWCSRATCCQSCPAGQFSDKSNSDTCSSCPAGRFQSLKGQAACIASRSPCGPGSFESRPLSLTSDRICRGCNANCRPGYQHVGCKDRSRGKCQACPTGKFKKNWGAFHCRAGRNQQELEISVNTDEVCPGKPVEVTVSSKQNDGQPSNRLAFQTFWDPKVLMLEDMKRSSMFAPNAQGKNDCEQSIFATQALEDAAECNLPVACLHGIADAVATGLYNRMYRHGDKLGCTYRPPAYHHDPAIHHLSKGQYGWVIRDAVRSQFGKSWCPELPHIAPALLWKSPTVRGCMNFVNAILQEPNSPYMTRFVKPRDALKLVKPCMLHHQSRAAAFLCASKTAKPVPSAALNVVKLWLRASPTLRNGADTTHVGVVADERQVGDGYIYHPLTQRHKMVFRSKCPPPKCAAGQRSTQVDGLWCASGACCTDCAPGKFSPTESHNVCITCPIGRFQPDFGKNQCLSHRRPCENGSYEAAPATATSDRVCASCDENCAAGKYHTGCTKRSGGACVVCPKGRFQAMQTSSSIFQCAFHSPPCPAGKFEAAAGSSLSDRRCVTCPKGKLTCHAPKQQRLALKTVPESDWETPLAVCPGMPVALRITSSQSDAHPTNMLAFKVQWDSEVLRLVSLQRSPALNGKCDKSLSMVLAPPIVSDKCQLKPGCLASIAHAIGRRVRAKVAAEVAMGSGWTQQSCTADDHPQAAAVYGWAVKDAVEDAIAVHKQCPEPETSPKKAWRSKRYTSCYPEVNALIDVPNNPYLSEPALVARVKPCLIHHQTNSVGFLCTSKNGTNIIPAEVEDVLRIDLRAAIALKNMTSPIRATMSSGYTGVGYSFSNPLINTKVVVHDKCGPKMYPKCSEGQYTATANGVWCTHPSKCCKTCPAGTYSGWMRPNDPLNVHHYAGSVYEDVVGRTPYCRPCFDEGTCTGGVGNHCTIIKSNFGPSACSKTQAGAQCVWAPDGKGGGKCTGGVGTDITCTRVKAGQGACESTTVFGTNGNCRWTPASSGSKFFSKRGAKFCTPARQSCEVGSYELAKPTATSDRVCKVCSCGPGRQHKGCGGKSAGECQECPVGKYKPTWGAFRCIDMKAHPCPVGKFLFGQAIGSKIDNACLNCPHGKFSDREGQVKCKPFPCCKAGYYVPTFNGTVQSTCATCPAGKYLTTVRDKHCAGTQCSSQPTSCPARMQLVRATTTTRGVCELCPPASFKANSGIVCTQCPAGRFGLASLRGAASLHAACFDCPAGKFQERAGQTFCKPCAAAEFADSTLAIRPGVGGASSAYCKTCLVSQWTPFGQCSKTCGTGSQTRTRKLVGMAAAHADARVQCQHLLGQQRVCNTKGCVNGPCYNVRCRFTTDPKTHMAVMQVLHHHKESHIVHHCRMLELGDGRRSCTCICNSKEAVAWADSGAAASAAPLVPLLGMVTRNAVELRDRPVLTCGLPASCIHAITHSVVTVLLKRVVEGHERNKCSLHADNVVQHGWILRDAVGSQFSASAAVRGKCPPLQNPEFAWRDDQVRPCLRFVALLIARKRQYNAPLGSHAISALKRLLPCIESAPRATGDWQHGVNSAKAFNATDQRYGVGFVAHTNGSAGRAVVGLTNPVAGAGVSNFLTGVGHGLLVTSNALRVVEHGKIMSTPVLRHWQLKEGMPANLQVRVNLTGYFEYVVDGHVFYSSADRAIYPLRVTAGLFDDTIALRDVHWLDRRIQQPPDAAKLAKVGAPQDLVWETVPGSAIPTHGAQLRSDEQQHLNNVWAAHVAAANEAAR